MVWIEACDLVMASIAVWRRSAPLMGGRHQRWGLPRVSSDCVRPALWAYLYQMLVGVSGRLTSFNRRLRGWRRPDLKPGENSPTVKCLLGISSMRSQSQDYSSRRKFIYRRLTRHSLQRLVRSVHPRSWMVPARRAADRRAGTACAVLPDYVRFERMVQQKRSILSSVLHGRGRRASTKPV